MVIVEVYLELANVTVPYAVFPMDCINAIRAETEIAKQAKENHIGSVKNPQPL